MSDETTREMVAAALRPVFWPHYPTVEKATDALLASPAADALRDEGAARALREAAREAEERGDVGKGGGVEAWDWLRGIIRRKALNEQSKSGWCDDCPDHEGCATGVPCVLAKAVAKGYPSADAAERGESSVEKDAPRLLAKDGRPGCPVTVWDGPYSTRCGAGAAVGKCAHHGSFARAAGRGES